MKVLRTGEFPLRVKSSTGAVQSKTISIARPDGATGKLALELAGSFGPGQVFDVLAKVTDPVPKQMLTLHLPAGLERAQGQANEPVPDANGKVSTVLWKVKVQKPGKYAVRVSSSTGLAQTKTLTIIQPDGGAGRFNLLLGGDFAPGKVFTVSAQVFKPLPGQTLTLVLPDNLQRVAGQEKELIPAAGNDDQSTVAWKVQVAEPGKFPVRVQSSTGESQKKTITIGRVDARAGKFTLELIGAIQPGKDFGIRALVSNPVEGQKLTLTLPTGLKLLTGDREQLVPRLANGQTQGSSSVEWQAQIVGRGRLPIRVESTTGIARTKTITISGTDGPALFGK